jgi:hypothetical protein
MSFDCVLRQIIDFPVILDSDEIDMRGASKSQEIDFKMQAAEEGKNDVRVIIVASSSKSTGRRERHLLLSNCKLPALGPRKVSMITFRIQVGAKLAQTWDRSGRGVRSVSKNEQVGLDWIDR